MFVMMLIVVGGLFLLAMSCRVVVSTGLTEAGVRADFFESLDTTTTYWQDLSTRLPSTTKKETYGFLGSIPQMREWGSGRLAKGIRSETYDIESQEYEATIAVDRKEIEDDQTGQIRLRIQEMAGYAATHKDYLIEQLLINGESVGFHAYDGVPFFNANHVSGASGAQTNLLTYGAADADNPTQAEFRAALTQAIAAMIAYRDDTGQPKRVTPAGLVCVVPPTMLFTALEAINLQLVGTGAIGAAALQSNVIQNAARVIALPGLTDASEWYLLKTDVPIRPFIFQDRLPVEFQAVAEGSEDAFIKGRFLYGVRARYCMTYGYWQYAVRTDFT
ncbi:MAG TPA: Mu-like prophage major head subunit gpT family protein [Phycisphaerae bacterium]|nr:Mu-like prophage major head subunit gpT family protein [Phycisphaerae bacterium]